MNALAPLVRPAPKSRFQIGATAQRSGQSSAEYWGIRFIAVTLLVWAASFVIGFQLGLNVLTLIGFGAAAIGIRKQPVIGMLGIGIICTLDPMTQTLLLSGGILRWNSLNYLMMVATVIGLPFLLRLNDPHTRVLQLFALLLGLELIVSPDISTGIQDLLGVLILFGFLVYFARACDQEHIWYWLGLVTGVLAAAGGLVYYLQQSS